MKIGYTVPALTSAITRSVKKGLYIPNYAGEMPTFDRILASIPRPHNVSIDHHTAVCLEVYKKLRKNGVLADLRRMHSVIAALRRV